MDVDAGVPKFHLSSLISWGICSTLFGTEPKPVDVNEDSSLSWKNEWIRPFFLNSVPFSLCYSVLLSRIVVSFSRVGVVKWFNRWCPWPCVLFSGDVWGLFEISLKFQCRKCWDSPWLVTWSTWAPARGITPHSDSFAYTRVSQD